METIEKKIDEFVNFTNKYAHNGFISPIMMENFIEERLNLSLPEIVGFVNSTKIVVTAEQIIEYLNKLFELEHPNLKKRIESKTDRKSILKLSDEELNNLSINEFSDEILALKYEFDPASLNFLKLYINILKRKILKLSDLINWAKLNKLKQYENDNVKNIRETLLKYGIQMNEDGDIHYQGFINLLTPFIYNVLKLKDVLEQANKLDTYVFFYLADECLSKRGFTEEKLFPTLELQILDYKNDSMRGNIPLSDEQRNQLQQEYMQKLEAIDETTIDGIPSQYVKADSNK